MKQAPDIPLREKNLQCDNNQAYGTAQAKPLSHYENISQQRQAKDSNAPESHYENTSQQHQAKDSNAPESHYENTSQQHQVNDANAPEPEYMVIPQHQ